MIHALGILLAVQLLGEALSRLLVPVVPGPVVGLVLLLVALSVSPTLAARLHPTATGLLAHLSLMFVPAGVGVVAHLDLLARDGAWLVAILVLSTIAALALGALSFVALARLTGRAEQDQP